MTNYDLLLTIDSLGAYPQYTDVLNALIAKGYGPMRCHRLMQNLLNEGYIKGELSEYRTISLTPKGYAHLQELEDSIKELNENSRKIVSEKNKNNVFQILLVLLGGVITLLVEHFPAIIEFIRSLLH